MAAKLKGHRLQQLRELLQRGAISRETAAPVSFDYAFRPVTLSAMIGEGLVQQAQLPLHGDSRRRVSHYWLTEAGKAAVHG